MRFSQKGAKDNRKKLARTRYFKYTVEDEKYFIKEKVYTTYCDALIDLQMIKERTYQNAIKRGNECIEVIIEEDIMETSLNALALIYGQEFEIYEDDARESILKSKAYIKRIRKDSKTSAAVEYKIFKKVLNNHINQIKEKEDAIWNV